MMQKLQKKEFRTGSDNVEQILAADNTIAGIELAKALNFDPSSVIKSVETTEEMMKTFGGRR
jgi:prolyl-tRNA editing enzyme YbaK/EbsC (Cys-tRNA(Pro) deacylase)